MTGRLRATMGTLQAHDPGLAALRYAARAALVMAAVLAVADQVIRDPQAATFAVFGSITFSLPVEFGGPVRGRLAAYLCSPSHLRSRANCAAGIYPAVSSSARAGAMISMVGKYVRYRRTSRVSNR